MQDPGMSAVGLLSGLVGVDGVNPALVPGGAEEDASLGTSALVSVLSGWMPHGE